MKSRTPNLRFWNGRRAIHGSEKAVVPSWRRYLVALICVGIAFAIRYWLTPILGEELPFLMFIAAALIATWYGGAVAGIMALLLGLTLGECFYMLTGAPSNVPLSISALRILRYVFTATLGIVMIEVLRRGKRRTEIAAEELRRAKLQLSRHAGELEQRVAARTAELAGSVESLKELLYHIAHNLRSPLRCMEGYSTLLAAERGDNLTGTERDYLNHISAAAKQMDTLIQDLLEYGRLGHVQIELEPVPVSAAIASARFHLDHLIREKQARIDVLGAMPEIFAHRDLLEQILANLLENALKFVPPGVPPHVQIRAENRGAAARLWVEDNGIGVPVQYRERIFGVFERLHPLGTYEGTGIGLAIVKQGAERMGGRAGVEPRAGTGSRFWLEFRTVPHGARRPETAPSSPAAQVFSRLTEPAPAPATASDSPNPVPV